MADFEDSLSPTWENVAHGQQNLYDAVQDTNFENPANGKKYALNDDPAILMCRVKGGIHLQEKGDVDQ